MAAQVQNLCSQWQIKIHTHKAFAQSHHTGLEAADRNTRYRFFAELSDTIGAQALLLGHHADDQVETVLLRLLRGSGVAGLAAMPAIQAWHNTILVRPLLAFSRTQIETYAHSQALQWVEDDFNRDIYFPRNAIRHAIFPLIIQHFPHAAHTIQRYARHSREHAELAEEIAKADWQAHYIDSYRLRAPNGLSAGRRKNLLRYWLQVAQTQTLSPLQRATMQLLGLNEARLQEWLRQCSDKKQGHAIPELLFGTQGQNWGLREWGGNWWLEQLPQMVVSQRLAVLSEACVWLPLHCKIHFAAYDQWPDPLWLRCRKAGDKIAVASLAATCDLKTLFAHAGVPPWQRAYYPLVVNANDEIIAVPSVAHDYRLPAAARATLLRGGV